MEDRIYKELLKIADDKDIEIINYTFKSIDIKGLYRQEGNIKMIALNESLENSPIEKNFILAHELAHAELHTGQIKENLYFNNKSYREKLELEANNYASTLLDEITGRLNNEC